MHTEMTMNVCMSPNYVTEYKTSERRLSSTSENWDNVYVE